MPKPQPKPDRFKRPELQSAYEMGFHQEYDHDSSVLLDRFSYLLDQAPTFAAGVERMAAMLDGAADALDALAEAWRADLPLHRAMDLEDLGP